MTFWRSPYSAAMARQFLRSLFAVPLALHAIVRTRRVRDLLALPLAALSTVLTVALAWTVLINVLAYPFRPWLGLHSEARDIWSNSYHDSWGGPSLAGAWATHAALVLLLGVPAFAWAVHGLDLLQTRLQGDPPQSRRRRESRKITVHRGTAVAGAVVAFLGLAWASHLAGIGDNLLWLPHNALDTAALAITVAPLAALGFVAATTWRHNPA